ncbi:MAG: tyrosine--tRNA ligase, partial [Candidatus Taylorbacteria bacterium]|nr:tyrosine--tRNA ligase [Candidatus Taylorbacteria bacterium]
SNAAQVRYNSNWLKDMTLEDSIKILANLTYAQTIKRDMFQKRIEDGKDLYLHEFMYPMMQAYDSVAMDVDGEVGGNDQVFNMLVGRDLMKKMKNKGKFVLALKLLADQSGKKMGKTEGNMVALNERPEQIFGKVMSWGDSMIMLGFELCTLVPWAELAGLKDQLDKGVNPRDLKLKLAEEIVSICHSKPAALAARTSFLSVFAEGVMPENATEIEAAEGGLLVEEALKSGIVFSKSEFRRLIDEGAVKDMESGQKITDVGFKVKQDSSFKIGKHRFLKIKIK